MTTKHSNPVSNLSDTVAADLKRRIESGDWEPGDRLPGEHTLANQYGVSRATIRTALQDLESRGSTLTRHGHGTVVMPSAVPGQSDIRRLESITDTIRNQGHRPSMKYRSVTIREADETERNTLRLEPGESVLVAERVVLADDEVIGFSLDVIPRTLLGEGFKPSDVSGSLFSLLDRNGVQTAVAVTELHADHGPHIGWGERPSDASYLKLVQLHCDMAGTPVFVATTHFIEGRFQFGLVRHR